MKIFILFRARSFTKFISTAHDSLMKIDNNLNEKQKVIWRNWCRSVCVFAESRNTASQSGHWRKHIHFSIIIYLHDCIYIVREMVKSSCSCGNGSGCYAILYTHQTTSLPKNSLVELEIFNENDFQYFWYTCVVVVLDQSCSYIHCLALKQWLKENQPNILD